MGEEDRINFNALQEKKYKSKVRERDTAILAQMQDLETELEPIVTHTSERLM
jgi:hypothetical protein